MKKQISLILAICLILFLAGCTPAMSKPSQTVDNSSTNTQPTSETTENIVYQAPMAAVSVPTITENLLNNDGSVLFQYTYQNMSLTLQDPGVADKVIINFLSRIDSTRELAETTAEMAKFSYNGSETWVPYLYHVTYNPTRIDHSVLSLFGTNVVYSGAFHPDRTCVSASYDLITGDVLTLASIMSHQATPSDFCKLVLDGLSEMSKGNYLYENYAATVTQRFMVDASKDEDWYFTQTGLCFYFAPYEIAPYSTGIISVEIPYEKLTGLLYDAYFPSERNISNGSVTVAPFENTDLSQFSQIAEVIENKSGNMYFLYPDDSIQDVRILVSDAASSYTIFAAYELNPGDAIMVQAEQSTLQHMSVTYKSANEIISTPLIDN